MRYERGVKCARSEEDATLPVRELRPALEAWYLQGEIDQLSAQTMRLRRLVGGWLIWWMNQRELPALGPVEVKQLLAHIGRPLGEGETRWGGKAPSRRQLRPGSMATYFAMLSSFFRQAVEDEFLARSPLEGQRGYAAKPDQIQPFTPEQVQALLAAAKGSRHPRRNEAIVLTLYDTGIRACELCGLSVQDVDLAAGRMTVLGKGNQRRGVCFAAAVRKALLRYLNEQERAPTDALFLSDTGVAAGRGLTTKGLLDLIKRLGQAAGIDRAVRCSPHTFRHSFAVEFLRAGGNVFTLKQILGHTSLAMTNRYVALAQADLAAQQRQFSPADRLKGRGRR